MEKKENVTYVVVAIELKNEKKSFKIINDLLSDYEAKGNIIVIKRIERGRHIHVHLTITKFIDEAIINELRKAGAVVYERFEYLKTPADYIIKYCNHKALGLPALEEDKCNQNELL